MNNFTREESENLLSALTESSLIGIYILQDGKLCYTNPKFQHTTGFTEQELETMNPIELVIPEDRKMVRENAILMLKGERNHPYEFRTRVKTGEIIWSMEVVNSIIYKGKRAVLSNYIDITERKTVEEQLIVSERLATLGQFSGNISHELRNPLGVIGSSVYFLEMKLKDAEDKVHEHLNRIKSSVDKSAAIIESLLNLTRMKEPNLTRLVVNDVISDALVTTKLLKSITVVREDFDPEALVEADHEQLRMALKNIFRNAGDAMQGEGTLRIALGVTEDEIEISITDTGPGISDENLDKVFQPLFTTKTQGIGFGLSITRTIIEKHGGKIMACSAEGTGACFTISLPRASTR